MKGRSNAWLRAEQHLAEAAARCDRQLLGEFTPDAARERGCPIPGSCHAGADGAPGAGSDERADERTSTVDDADADHRDLGGAQ